MEIKKVLSIIVGIKIVLCVSVISIHHVFGTIWFDPTSSNADVRREMRFKPNVNAYNENGITGLMLAAQQANVELATILLDAGATINLKSQGTNTQDEEGNTALHYACQNGDQAATLQMVELLVNRGANVNAQNNKMITPFHLILNTDDIKVRKKILHVLLSKNAFFNAQNKDGNTHLHLAVSLNDKDWIAYLLKSWASRINFALKNKNNYTPQQMAASLRFDEVTALFGSIGLFVGQKDVNERDTFGLTGVMLAIVRDDMPFVKSIIEKGAQVNAQVKATGNTALHIACLYSSDPLSYIKILLENQADPMIANVQKETPLHILGQIKNKKQQQDIVTLLIKYGAKLMIKDSGGMTPLMRAVKANDKELVIMLKNAFGTVVTNQAGKTAAGLAKELKFYDIEKVLRGDKL